MALVAALASDAELLLLDEPTSGLDPLMEATFQECVREMRDEGRTMLLSSHILAEAEALCDRVSIIRSGRIVQTGSLAELRQLTRTTVWSRPSCPPTAWPACLVCCTSSGSTARSASTSTPTTSTRRWSTWRRCGSVSLVSHPPTLEELFLRQFGDGRARSRSR